MAFFANIRLNVDWKAWLQFNKQIVEHLLRARKREREQMVEKEEWVKIQR